MVFAVKVVCTMWLKTKKDGTLTKRSLRQFVDQVEDMMSVMKNVRFEVTRDHCQVSGDYGFVRNVMLPATTIVIEGDLPG